MALILYLGFVNWTFIEYRTYVNNRIQEWRRRGIPEELIPYMDPDFYFTSIYGRLAVIFGIGLLMATIFTIILAVGRKPPPTVAW